MTDPENNDEPFRELCGEFFPQSPVEPPLPLLSPDHPLLKKFQQLLKDHLLRTKEKFVAEVNDMKFDIKTKEKERTSLGAKLYDIQQDLHIQNEHLDAYIEDIQAHLECRNEEEKMVEVLKVEFQTKHKLSKDQKSLYNRRMLELEHMNTLENNIRKWAEEIEEEVKNAKRVVSRDAQLQQQISEEKKKSDVMFFNLDMEVKKRENELATSTNEMAEMQEALDALNLSVTNANADLEVLQTEHKHLTQAWGEVIVAIQHRDKILYHLQKSTDAEKETIKLCNSSIDAIKKQITKELKQNEKLELFKNRLVNDFNSLRRECLKQNDILNSLEAKLEDLPRWLEKTEKDFQEARKEGNQLESELRRIQWKIDKQYNKRFQIEENILKVVQDQLITDKASDYRLKLLNIAQEKRRNIELSLAQSQNCLNETLLSLEQLNGELIHLKHENHTLNQILTGVEEKYDEINLELKKLQIHISSKLQKIERLNHELVEIAQSSESIDKTSTERKIMLLEKALQMAENQIREHQQFWIMLQNHYVNLSQKRNNQLNQIQVTRKELSIIKQRSLKIDNELESTEAQMRELNRDIQLYTAKIGLLNAKIFKKRHEHENEENECKIEHSELLEKLKSNEMNVLKLESEINDLQTDLEHHKDLVLEKHREALSWETKYKLIEETIRWRKDENNYNSEVGHMKTEIHRMEIRYGQLKRAQEKLVQDMEHCVLHREQIFVNASIKKTMEARRVKQIATIDNKVTEFRNKLRQLQKDLTFVSGDQLNESLTEQNAITTEIMDKKIQLEALQLFDKQIRKEIDEVIYRKQKNLELIIRKQNRAKAYRRLNCPTLSAKIPRSESTIEMMGIKQNEMNDTLLEIIKLLEAEFPEKLSLFTKLNMALRV